jgi:aspartate 1-decarboxylase
MREVLKSKLYGVFVTETNLTYEGSITIDEDWMDKVGLIEYEKVQVINLNNGARLDTYVIKGERGSKAMCLNGGGARLAQVDDELIILSYEHWSEYEEFVGGGSMYKSSLPNPKKYNVKREEL